MKPVMILAGGTGGHVFPALAVAKELLAYDVPVIWVGTKRGIEARVVPNAGINLETMHVQGLRGKGILKTLAAPFLIVRALSEAFKLIMTYKPCALLGMGGFVSGPCGIAAVLMRKPLIIHEQNAVPGLTNRILAPLCKKMFTGFPLQLRSKNMEYCGNPVRQDLLNIEHPETRLAGRSKCKHVLIVGGSQGAKTLNRVVPMAISHLIDDVEIWHQTGQSEERSVTDTYRTIRANAKVTAFIDDMKAAYSWADIIICRSGAMTLAEISAIGLGAILVPFPYAVDDHQTKNAQSFVENSAAFLISESDLNEVTLAELLKELLHDEEKLLSMACAAKDLSPANAAKRVANECILQGRLDDELKRVNS